MKLGSITSRSLLVNFCRAPSVSTQAATCRLSLKEEELDDVNDELKKLEVKVGALQQRNARLKETRETMMLKALREHKDFMIKNDAKETCEKEDVLREWQNLWLFQKEHEDELTSTTKKPCLLSSERVDEAWPYV
jgi:hypothetical protein